MRRKLCTIVLLSAVAFTACNGNLSKEREKQLQDSFAAVMSNKDAELETLFQQLNEIDASLGEIAKTYGEVAQASDISGEVNKDAVSSIRSKITTISNILASDREKLAAVSARISKNQRQNNQLQYNLLPKSCKRRTSR